MPAPRPDRPNAAGGVFIALGAIGGAVIGAIMRQPTIGVLAGVAVGSALAVAIWLRDRRP